MLEPKKIDLREAIRRGDVVKVKTLIDNPKSGARKSINVIENGGSTLHLAIGSKQEIITSILLDSGADPNQPDIMGYSPIHLAILAAEQLARKRRRVKAAELVQQQIKANQGYSSPSSKFKRLNSLDDLSTTLSSSSSSSSAQSKTRGATDESINSVEKKLSESKEPLEMGDFGLLTLLLSAGARVDQCRDIVSTGEVVASPLFEAVFLGEAELVRCLLEYGANPNKQGRARDRAYAEPPLHVAARRSCNEQVEICKLLLKFGAEPSAVAGGLGDDGEVYDLFDATEECSTGWIRSLITGMQMARRNEISDKIAKKKAKALAKAKILSKLG